ncbi:hypothetical protein CBOM_00816 [Ceraceosorus bombacis]|uniref:Uncharacterized protein n=1 Tax=Ceraceosorus bombacis TaxID=401625 RepID=A0A0P1BB38_9BASI|nr:hypothetical protein CBOM_00816 [Ceraceosorus bombacis]
MAYARTDLLKRHLLCNHLELDAKDSDSRPGSGRSSPKEKTTSDVAERRDSSTSQNNSLLDGNPFKANVNGAEPPALHMSLSGVNNGLNSTSLSRLATPASGGSTTSPFSPLSPFGPTFNAPSAHYRLGKDGDASSFLGSYGVNDELLAKLMLAGTPSHLGDAPTHSAARSNELLQHPNGDAETTRYDLELYLKHFAPHWPCVHVATLVASTSAIHQDVDHDLLDAITLIGDRYNADGLSPSVSRRSSVYSLEGQDTSEPFEPERHVARKHYRSSARLAHPGGSPNTRRASTSPHAIEHGHGARLGAVGSMRAARSDNMDGL